MTAGGTSAAVTREGVRGARPDREAVTGVAAGRRRRRRASAEQSMVPEAQFSSYYGKPILNRPVWAAPDIPGYLFLGGMAGAGSLLAAGAALTGRTSLLRVETVGAATGGLLSVVALVHDLGRPARFLNMLRVFKVTSPMSVGSWLLSGYVPLAGAAAASAVTGLLPRVGSAAIAGAALVGPMVASYTAVLVADTAVPAWHEAYRELPFVFVGSGAAAAGGLGLLAAPLAEQGPARALAVLGAGLESVAMHRMERRMGFVGEPYRIGRGGAYLKAAKALSAVGVGAALLGRHNRTAGMVAGAALLAASVATRWGVFHAGLQSADDPKYVVVPQRERLAGPN